MRYTEDIKNKKEVLVKVIYDLFDILMPLAAPEKKRSSKQKRKFTGTVDISPKRKKYDFQRK